MRREGWYEPCFPRLPRPWPHPWHRAAGPFGTVCDRLLSGAVGRPDTAYRTADWTLSIVADGATLKSSSQAQIQPLPAETITSARSRIGRAGLVILPLGASLLSGQ